MKYSQNVKYFLPRIYCQNPEDLVRGNVCEIKLKYFVPFMMVFSAQENQWCQIVNITCERFAWHKDISVLKGSSPGSCWIGLQVVVVN